MGAVVVHIFLCVRSTVLYYIILQWIVFQPFLVSTQLPFHFLQKNPWLFHAVIDGAGAPIGWESKALLKDCLPSLSLTNPPDKALLLAVLRGWVNTLRFTSYQFGGHESMFFSFHAPSSKKHLG